MSELSKFFTSSAAARLAAFFIPSKYSFVSKVLRGPVPAGEKPNSPNVSKFLLIELEEYSSNTLSPEPLNALIPLPAPIIPKLNNAPSVPNLILFFNLLKASSLPSLSSLLSIIVTANGSREVPLAISANVPISSSATNASPIPPPTTPPAVGVIILEPILLKLKNLLAFLVCNAFEANDAPIL